MYMLLAQICFVQGAADIWGKLTNKMYGDCNRRLIQRMFIAWRRRRVGSIRDRVLSSLQSEGVLTVLNNETLSANTSESVHPVHNHTDANVENCSDALVSNGYRDLENVSAESNDLVETFNNTPVYRNNERVNSASIERNHDRVSVSRLRHQNNVHVRHKLAVSSYSLRGMYNFVMFYDELSNTACLGLTQCCLKLLHCAPSKTVL